MKIAFPGKCLLLLALALASIPCFALNSLSIRKDYTHGSFPGYIDDAQIVVEPKVGYASVSLFLTYADHGLFSGSDVEVVHSFELPPGSLVDDLWLWFGDSVMQARVYALPRAQYLYDSVTAFKHDPAFLKLANGQYELHIFPLRSGSFRKVKISYQCPMSWSAGSPRIPLPLGLLLSNNLAIKPVRVLLRVGAYSAQEPVLLGVSSGSFTGNIDTLGYRYRTAALANITGASRLDLAFQPTPPADPVFISDRKPGKGNLFAFGFDPGGFFSLPADSRVPGKTVFGLDLSGKYEPDMATLSANLQSLLSASFLPGDSVKLIVAGAGKTESYPSQGWLPATAAGAAAWARDFQAGAIYGAKLQARLPRILMTDAEGSNCWGFPGLDKLAKVTVAGGGGIYGSLDRFDSADVIAAYGQGYEDRLTASQAAIVLDSLDAFFARGGWFLTYIDFNRKNELLATHLIKGLQIPTAFQTTTLSAVPQGTVGRGLPASMHHQTNNPLINSDPEAASEMVDAQNRPVILSKRIGKGLLIVSGVWSNNDPDGIKKPMSAALLGLQRSEGPMQLPALLAAVAAAAKNSAARVLIASNADSAYDSAGAADAVNGFLSAAGSPAPQTNAIDLLTGQNYVPPSSAYQGQAYPGSGLVLKFLADAAHGQYLAGNAMTWPQIQDALTPASHPRPLSLEVAISPPSPTTPDAIEIAPAPGNPDKPRFFVGAAADADSIRVSLKARFEGLDSLYQRSVSFPTRNDTSLFGSGLPSLLAGQTIAGLWSHTPLDTARIVALALGSGLVTDFTALLALEPKDTVRFLRDPKDESGIDKNPTTALAAAAPKDTLSISGSFSVSENAWRLTTYVPARGRLQVAAYDLAGRKLFAWDRAMASKGRFDWTGPAAAASQAKCIVVFARFQADEAMGGKKEWVKIAKLAR